MKNLLYVLISVLVLSCTTFGATSKRVTTDIHGTYTAEDVVIHSEFPDFTSSEDVVWVGSNTRYPNSVLFSLRYEDKYWKHDGPYDDFILMKTDAGINKIPAVVKFDYIGANRGFIVYASSPVEKEIFSNLLNTESLSFQHNRKFIIVSAAGIKLLKSRLPL